MSHASFATALNCMDGRVQIPVIEKARDLFGVDNVDNITEAGIIRFLSDDTDSRETEAALGSIRISVEKHGSRAIAVAAHPDCAGNAVEDATQKEQLVRAVAFLSGRFPDCRVAGFWVEPEGVEILGN